MKIASENTATPSNIICIIGVPEGEKRERGRNIFEEIIAKSFLKLGKEIDIQDQEAKKFQTR